MATAIRLVDTAMIGETIYFAVRNDSNQWWYLTTPTFESYNTAHKALYGTAMSDADDLGVFIGTFPSAIAAGWYDVYAYQQAGGSQDVEVDTIVGVSRERWNGTSLLDGAATLADVVHQVVSLEADNFLVNNDFDVAGDYTIDGVLSYAGSPVSILDAAGVRTAVGLGSANLDTQLSAIDDYVDTEIAAIKAKTDQLTFTVANEVNANTRYVSGTAQTAADVGLTAKSLQPVHTGTLQSSSSNTVTLASGANSGDEYYTYSFFVITGGTGFGQTARIITGYTGSTKVATVSPGSWQTQPDNTTTYAIVPFANTTTGVWQGSVVGNIGVNVVNWRGTACPAPTVAGVPAVEVIDMSSAGQSDVRAAVGLATANLDTQLSSLSTKIDTVDDYVDTEIADIRSRLPAALDGGYMSAKLGNTSHGGGSASVEAGAGVIISSSDSYGLLITTTAEGYPAASIYNDASGSDASNIGLDIEAGPGGKALFVFGAAEINHASNLINLGTNKLNADVLAADAVAEIGGGGGGLDAAGVRAAIGLATANLDTQLASLSTKIDTVDDYVDTEVAAIKAKTDQLTFTVANEVNANTRYFGGTSQTTGKDVSGLVEGLTNTWHIEFDPPKVIEVPASGSRTFRIYLAMVGYRGENVTDSSGPGSPTIVLLNQAGTNLTATRLTNSSGVMTYTSGRYRIDYTSTAGDADGSLIWQVTSQYGGYDQVAYRQSVVQGSLASIITKIDTVDDYVDTELAAIKAKTDNLPSDPASAATVASRFTTLDTSVAALPTEAELATALDAAFIKDMSALQAGANPNSLCTVILARLHSSVVDDTWTIYETDDSTVHLTKTITRTDGALPITGVSG